MRKSIFLTVILALWSVLIFGQGADSNATPTKPSNCSENENFPAIGIPHDYEVSVTATNGYDGDGTYYWYVTQDAGNLLTETTAIAKTNNYFDVTTPTATYSDYKTGTGTTKRIGLTWKTDALLNTNGTSYFLVLKYSEDNGTCDAMNMKVMKIEPLNRFKLDIDPMTQDLVTVIDGETATATVCAADVDGATYSATTNKVTYTYGENTLYYQVTASGFIGKWKPQISLPALAATGEQKYVSAQWSKDGGTTWTDFDGLATNGSAQTLTTSTMAEIPAPATSGDTPTANYIYKVVIDNERYETLEEQTLNVATDGTYGGATNESLKDQKDNCSGDEDTFADKDNYVIKARPKVTATSGGFIQRVQ